MTDRREDYVTRDRIDEIAASYDKSFKIILAKLKTLKQILYSIVVVVVITAFVSVYLINDNRHRSDRINKSRATNMYNNCRDQNARNINTKKVLHNTIQATIKSGQITAAGGEASEQFTVLLINALAPVRDCNAIILDQTKHPPVKDKRSLSIYEAS